MSEYELNHDLGAFMVSAQEQMAKDYERFRARSKEDPGTAGAQGEGSWASLLEAWLPASFQVKTQCRLLGYSGQVSRQVDLVILRPEYPKGLLKEKYVLADGALAAFECKLTLRDRDLEEFFTRAISMKKTVSDRLGDPYLELQRPILTGLLAHSYEHAPHSTAMERISNRIETLDQKLIEHPNMMPDLFCIADLASWSAKKHTVGPLYPMNNSSGPHPLVSTSYSLHRKAIRALTPVGALITSIWGKLTYEYPSMGPIANYFIDADLHGVAAGKSRLWAHTVLSDTVVEEIMKGRLNNNLASRWCMMTVS